MRTTFCRRRPHRARWPPSRTAAWPKQACPAWKCPTRAARWANSRSLWRQQFHLPLIAVTGSNGKTTVTQMIASILRAAAGDAAHATQGNFNNDIGVPLTLLRLNASHQLSVVELGMNHPGEIAELAALTRPTVALVNNAQREHQEFMATVEAVALENGQVIRSLADDGVAVFPSDDTYTPLWRGLAAGRRVVTFSDIDPAADVVAVKTDWQDGAWTLCFTSIAGKGTVHLKIAGRHNVRNALAATACALAAGVTLDAVVRGLNAFEPVGGRSRALALHLDGRTITLIDDTYNANPDSVRAAIDVLAELPAPRLLVLGDMGEVGEQGLAFHEEVLRHARDRGIEAVHVAGDWMRQAAPVWPAVTHWNEVPAMAGAVCAAVSDDRPVFQQRAGQGLALHAHRACGERLAGAGPRTRQQQEGQRPCCLAWPSGCKACRPNSVSCGCSST